MNDELISSLTRAVASEPDDLALRLHLAGLLIEGARPSEAVVHLEAVLNRNPDSVEARALMGRVLGRAPADGAVPRPSATDPVVAQTEVEAQSSPPDFDWVRAEGELGDAVAPMFRDADAQRSEVAALDLGSSPPTLADVGGMQDVKRRLEAAFLAPMRNEALRRMYRKSLRGGLLLYGPPGCGKTFIAQALAGELGASFVTVSLAEVLDMYVGQSEKNVHELFETVRSKQPCVLFLDEVDAIGHKRSRTTSDGMRSAVNQLLLELDSVGDNNAGVFVLAATNHPWDVDPALRRPGRLDRTMLVPPPNREARAAIWRHHLRERPVAAIDIDHLAKISHGYSGADIAHICESAAENALLQAVDTGLARMINHDDITSALRSLRPSTGPWFETARNVVMFANDDGSYDELRRYIRRR